MYRFRSDFIISREATNIFMIINALGDGSAPPKTLTLMNNSTDGYVPIVNFDNMKSDPTNLCLESPRIEVALR